MGIVNDSGATKPCYLWTGYTVNRSAFDTMSPGLPVTMDNIAILKYTVLIAATPIWWPFVKTLYLDLKDALREDGGLFGDPPHPRKLEEIRREKELQESHMIHEPRIVQGRRSSFGGGSGGRRSGGARSGGGTLRRSGGAASTGAASARGGSRRGFR